MQKHLLVYSFIFRYMNKIIIWFTLTALLNQWFTFLYKVLRTIFRTAKGGDIEMVHVPASVCPSVCLSPCTSLQGLRPLSGETITHFTSNLTCTCVRWIFGHDFTLVHLSASGGQNIKMAEICGFKPLSRKLQVFRNNVLNMLSNRYFVCFISLITIWKILFYVIIFHLFKVM